MGDWYVYDESGDHRGPISVEALVAEICAQQTTEDALIAPERWFEEPGASGWRRAGDEPEIRTALAAERAGELRLVEGAFKANRLGAPEFGATVMMVGSVKRPPTDG